jgi:hypothetical protein
VGAQTQVVGFQGDNDDGEPDEVKVHRMLVVERSTNPASSAGSDALGHLDSVSSKRSSKGVRTNSINVIQTERVKHAAVLPSSINKEKLGAFRESLSLAGVDSGKWGTGGSKSVEHLFWRLSISAAAC